MRCGYDKRVWWDLATKEACIWVLGIQDICHFTSRDIGYFPFYFQGYGILRSTSGILLFFLHNIQIQSRNTTNINKNHFKISTNKEEQLYVQDMASLSRHSISCSAKCTYFPSPKMLMEVEVTA